MIFVKYSSQILCEYEGFRLARKYVYGPGIDEPVRMTILPNTDLNGDSSTDLQDIYVMSASWMRHSGDPAYNHTADLNSDGVVDNLDADILAGNWRAVNAAGQHYYYHFDGLGSVIALTDSSGKTVEIYRYSAFGQTTIYNAQNHPIAASQVGNIYYFTGRQLDTETGLYYYRARMYSPALGRFMQTDPVGYADGMNWYAYCVNNPVNFADPLGLCSKGRDPLDFSNLKSYEIDDAINGLTEEQKNELRRRINDELGEMYWELQKRNLIPFHYKKIYIPGLLNECNDQALSDSQYLNDKKDWKYWNPNGYVS
ncbi:MAG TPA: RHS repeat-associated core domain-containing protein, partial [Anaerohalosphaeraceae bacterium]|nr:RHS repeat-associated core domain-containing protein [Anaerohalosphaeraceae bacterium]